MQDFVEEVEEEEEDFDQSYWTARLAEFDSEEENNLEDETGEQMDLSNSTAMAASSRTILFDWLDSQDFDDFAVFCLLDCRLLGLC